MTQLATFILQAITPSWKFFEEAGHIPRLSVRTDGEWFELTPVYKRGIGEFFVNSKGNFELAKVTLLERFVDAIQEADEANPETLINGMAYQLVKAMAQNIVKAKLPDAETFQFRIELIDQREPETREEIFVSPESEA